MASKDLGRMKNSNSVENLAGDIGPKAEEISWLIDNLPVTVFRASSKLSWGMDYISKNVEKLTGYSRNDFVNQKLSWSEIVFPEDISIIDKAVQKAKKSKAPYQVEYRIKKSDGSTALIQEQAHLILDDKGNLTYTYGVFSDINSQTKRRGESNKVLKEDERIQLEILRSFVESISTGEKLDKVKGDFTGGAKKTADLINCSVENITGILNEIEAVSKAVEEGNLNIRANSLRYPGEWGIILKETNNTLNSVIGPLNVAAEYVERISRGDIPEPITDNYNGDFNKIKNNLNNCIEGLQGLVECNNILQRMAVNDQTKGVEGEYVGIYASMGEATNLVRARVLNVTNVLENIAVGNTSRLEELKKIGRRSEQDRLMPAIVKAMENVSILIEDTEMLSRAAVEGKLDTRADASRHQGEYRKIVEGVNDTLDAVIGPLNVAAEYVERIGRGEIPEPITENYKGDFNEIKNNLNNCIEGLQGLVECNNILQRMAVNDQTKGVEGEYVGIYASMGEATNLVRARVLNVTKQLNNIAVGDSSELEGLKKIGKRSEQDQLLPAIIRAMENVKLLIEDTEMLSRAAIEGKLDTRADASRHQGEYRKIVEGVNDTLDSVIGPLNVAAEYVERISRGDIPKPITDNYNGDFNEIKNNLNTCITAVNRLIEDSLMLADAGVAGRLDTRADANRHEGDFRRIVTGVNDTLDSVIGPLNVAAEYVERISRGDVPEPITDKYNGDFNEIKNNLNVCIAAVNSLVSDAGMLVDAAIRGKLDTRADASVHQGDFQKIVEGVNITLDTLVGYIDRMPLPVMAIDTSYNILYMNETGSKLVGSTKEELNGKKCFSQFKTCDCQTQNCACARAMEKVTEITSQTLAKPMEKELEISYTGIPIKNQKGEVTGAFEFVQDQTASVKVTKYLNNEVEKLGNNLDKLSNGDTDLHFEVSKADEYTIEAHKNFVTINEKLEKVNYTIKNLVTDARMLSEAAVEGRLDTRADASKHPGDFRKIVEGVNDTLDAVIGPLNVAAEYVERISRGDIPEPITDNYNGDFNEIKNNLNTCIAAVNNLVEDSLILSKAGIAGQLDTRADASRHEGDFRKVVSGVNETLDAVIGPLNVAAEYVERISRGDIPKPITDNYNGDFNEIKNNLNTCIVAVNNLVEDSLMLSEASIIGKLDTRADATRHEGDFRRIVEGVNDTLDAVIGPLNVAAEYVERISRGDIPKPITDNYNGDFNEIKNNLNTCIAAVNNLIEDSLMLADAGVAGRLDTRADATRHEGDFRKIVEGVNNTLDSVIGPLNVAAEYVERISRGDIPKPITDNYNGDFNEIKNNLNTCITAVNRLIEDSLLLSEAAIEGRLDTRADATRHEGDFRKIVEGVNDTLDAVIGPLNVAAEYVERISRGDIPEPITDNYNGDFNKIKNNLNNCIEGLQGLVECNHILQRMAVNDQTKGVEGEYVGIYASMGEATNLVQSRILNVTNVLENIAIGNTSRLEELKKIGRRSEQDRLMPAIIRAMDNVNLLIEDTEMLSRAAVEGKLDTRTDASRHQGEYRKIVEGINDTLDAVIGPLNVSAEYVERISRGDIPEPITDNYNGDFNEIKNNLNTCIEAVNKLIEDSLLLSEAAVEGRLDTRADATRHEGDFRKIIEGINDTLDAVIGPLNEAIRVSNEFSNGNFRARVDEKLRIEGDFVNFKDVLNNIGISVSEIIKSSKSVTVDVAEHSNEASNGADEVARAAGEVAMSSQKSSELTRELLYKIESINREIIELSQSNEKIADTSKGILSTAHEVVNIGKDAQVLGQDTNFKMQSVEKIAKESVDRINNLTEKIKEIDSVVQLINDITSQINLLSLNAAIEAARAGEHGRGFAVVAGEVKNLASKARNATETIENVVISVQKDSKKTADAINDANKEIIDGVNSVNRTLDSLNTIIKNATQVTKDIDDIAKAIEGQTKISAKVVMASEEGNAMTREVQKESESLAAVAEETSASIEEIGAAIHEVTNLAKSLRSNMEVYSV